MKEMKMKKVLTAGLALAAMVAFGDAAVTNSSELTAQAFDTRTGESRILNGVDELLAFAYNNVPGWPKGGDTDVAAATVRMTPMIGVAGGVANWFPADVPYTLATDAGEATLDWNPTDGFTCYKAEMLIGADVVETAYINLNGADFEERATVTVIGGATMTVSVTTNDGQTLTGELTYRWYVYNPTNTWYEGLASTDTSFTPDTRHYEKAMRVLVFDENGYAGMSETLWCSKLPVVYITTENGQAVVSKDIDYPAEMRMQGNAIFTKSENLYSGPLTMHVRGNTTGNAEKKPYKIKLDSKANLLKMGKSKHWVLLSNPYDFSLMRNKVIYDFSAELGLTAMASEWVDVVMNGEYVGNYQLCEHIRVDETRVDIYDWEGEADDVADAIAATNGFSKAATKELETYLEQHLGWATEGAFTWTNGVTYTLADYNLTNEYDITGGYLFEIDPFADEVTMFNAGAGALNMLTKANRPEYLNSNPEMLDVARTIWSNYWAAIVSPDGYYRGVHYSQMCDLDSMVGFWLAQVLPAQQDYQWSRYAYKDNDGGLLTWGPAWDFDNACGGRDSGWTFNADGTIASRPNHMTGWYSGRTRYTSAVFFPDWNNDPYFVLKVWEKFNEVQDYLDNLLEDGGTFDEDYAYLLESGIANAERWAGKITTSYLINSNMCFEGENGSAAWFKATLKGRVAWMKGEFASIRRAVASLNVKSGNQGGTNPYTDSADKFAFDFVTPHVLRPVEGEGEGATPDIMISDASNLETRVTLGGLTAPATVDVYVNGLSNGTYTVESDAVAFTVDSSEFTNVGGHRNMISLVAKNGTGTTLATTYSLVTTVNEINYPQQISNATVVVDIATEVPATGEPYEPAVTVTTPDGVVLTNGLDYAVEYLNNVNPGTATVRITGLGNPYGEGEFPRGNWIGTIEKTFTIVASSISDVLEGISLDTRTNPVRKPESLNEILPFAWNGGSAWPTNGTGAGNAVVSVVPVAGEGTDPAAWTNAGPARTFVDEPGEGTNAWDRQYAKLYRATLVQDAGAATNTAYFDLRELDLPTDPVDLLKTAFGDNVEITLDAAGDPTVKLTEGRDGGVTVPAGVGAFTLDLNGCSIVGTNGLDLADGQHGGAGGAAIVVAEDTVLTLADASGGGRLVGGNGGAPRGKGGEAVAFANGAAAPVLGQTELLVKGQDGATMAVDTAELANLDFDTRVGAVRTPTAISDILPFAWNNTAGWSAGGALEGGNASVSVVPVNGEGTDPMAWIDDGPARTFVEAAGEGTNAWDRQYAKLYRATLVQEDGAVTNVAFFDLRGLDLPPDPVDFLKAAFGDGVEITLDAAGDPTVTLTDDLTGPVTLPAEVGAFTLDLAGKTLSGTNGVDGSAVSPGTAGGPAIVAGAGVEIRVAGPGAIVGGAGGDGNPPGEGGEAIVTSEGAKVDPVSVTGGATVEKGAAGHQGYETPGVEVVRVKTTRPWGGLVTVDYVCARLCAGYSYKVTFFVTVDGEERAWTVEVPQQEFYRESYSNTAVLRLDEKFGAKRDPRAKVFATIEPAE